MAAPAKEMFLGGNPVRLDWSGQSVNRSYQSLRRDTSDAASRKAPEP
jgi:hypothetical protein